MIPIPETDRAKFRGFLTTPTSPPPRVVSDALDGAFVTELRPARSLGPGHWVTWLVVTGGTVALLKAAGLHDAITLGVIGGVMLLVLIFAEYRTRAASRLGPLLTIRRDRAGCYVALPGCGLEWRDPRQLYLERLGGWLGGHRWLGGRSWQEINLHVTSHERHYTCPVVTLESAAEAETICAALSTEAGVPCTTVTGLRGSRPALPWIRRGGPAPYLAEAAD